MMWGSENFFATTGSVSPLILRVGLGLVFLPHGLQKTVGWFGGHGFAGTMDHLTSQAGLPWVAAFLVVLGESVGALSLIAGFATRFCAVSLALIMMGAIKMVHLQHGFFMNWFGQQKGEGIEYHVLVVVIAAVLLLEGGGRWSADREIADRLRRNGS